MSEYTIRRNKVAIVGAGSVGATLAYASLIRGVAHDVVLYDMNADKVEAEVLDLRHGLLFCPPADVDGSDDVAICAGADVIAITAGAKQKPGQTRLELAGTNVEICRALIPEPARGRPGRGDPDGHQPRRRAHAGGAEVLRSAEEPGPGQRHGAGFGPPAGPDRPVPRCRLAERACLDRRRARRFRVPAVEHRDGGIPSGAGLLDAGRGPAGPRERGADRARRWSPPPSGSSAARARPTTRSAWPRPG